MGSSVDPCESASNMEAGLSAGRVTAVQSPSFILDMFKGVTSPSLVTTMTPIALKVCDLYASYLQAVTVDAGCKASAAGSCSGTSEASSLVSAGSAATTSSVSVGSSVGTSRSKWRSARRAMAWRARNVPKTFPPGFCYARLFRSRARECVAGELGDWPTVTAVLSQPEEFAQHPCMLDDYRLAEVGSGRYHLLCPSDETTLPTLPLVDALVGFARRHEFEVGTFGRMLKGVRRVGCAQAVVDALSPGCVLGGDDYRSGYVKDLMMRRQIALENIEVVKGLSSATAELSVVDGSGCGGIGDGGVAGSRRIDETESWEPLTDSENLRSVVVQDGHLVRLPGAFVFWDGATRSGACSRGVDRLSSFKGVRCVNVYKSVGGTVLAHLLCKESVASRLAEVAGGEYVDSYGFVGDEFIRDKEVVDRLESVVFDYFSFVEGARSSVSLADLFGAAGFMRKHAVAELMGADKSQARGMVCVAEC